MAGVDSFYFLSKEITSVFTNIRDSLAAVGLFYISHNALKVCVHFANAFYVFAYSRFTQHDFRVKYGTWASTCSNVVCFDITVLNLCINCEIALKEHECNCIKWKNAS